MVFYSQLYQSDKNYIDILLWKEYTKLKVLNFIMENVINFLYGRKAWVLFPLR